MALTRQQIDRRVTMGDLLSAPRPTDHSAEFRRRRSAAVAAEELGLLRYDVTMGRRGLTKVLLEAGKTSEVDLASAEAFTREVFGVVAKHGGDYDGWGAGVEAQLPYSISLPLAVHR